MTFAEEIRSRNFSKPIASAFQFWAYANSFLFSGIYGQWSVIGFLLLVYDLFSVRQKVLRKSRHEEEDQGG